MEIRRHIHNIKVLVKFNLMIEMRYPLSYMSGLLNMFFWMLSFSILVMMLSRGTSGGMIVGNLIMWGFVAYIMFQGLIGEVGFGIARLQRRGTLEQIFLTPISPWILPIGLAGFTIIIHIIFVAAAVFLFVALMRIELIVANPIGGILAGILFLAMSYGLALLYAGWAIKAKRSGWALINAIQIVVMLFCGVFYSFRGAPKAVVMVSKLIPLSYAIDLLRTTIVGIEPELIPSKACIFGVMVSGVVLEWVLVFVLSIVILWLGYTYLLRTLKDAKVKGYLATY